MKLSEQIASRDASPVAESGLVATSGSMALPAPQSRWRGSHVLSGLMAGLVCSLLNSPLMAQESTTTTTTVVTSGRSFMIDGAIVVVLCGLAVFAVCRASRRS